ncbi:Uncharacterized protein TCM_008106 [Theobroma cacao]|uniref:Uncharacterized protein n=1 Tax=Theobroma cacao TaxID=3641 RepID=A0A061E465_THECC|nr:Uncharacterized protein TCM_008106 [Theobroma cacao]
MHAIKHATASAPLSDNEVVFHILNGLGSNFKEIGAAICAHEFAISFEELHDKLVDYEAFFKRDAKSNTTPIIANYARKPTTNNNRNDKNRQENNNGGTSQPCQRMVLLKSKWLQAKSANPKQSCLPIL